MYCPRCGTQNDDIAKFCKSCGHGFAATPVSSPVDVAEQTLPTEFSEVDLVRQDLRDEYEILEELGRGGMAIVFRSREKQLDREVAIKVLPASLAFDREFVERFQREARTSAKLEHPSIIPIYRVGRVGRTIYLVMKFLRGKTLSATLAARGALPPAEIRELFQDVCSALAYAHRSGVVHRDIKPDNIMLQASSGRPLLVDFGIAKQVGGGGHKTQTGLVVGTPQYMSPEQALGQGDLDARSDLYAIGAVLYQMVTGAPPFEGDTSQEIVGKHLSEPAPIATARNARIPMWLSEVIVRCLAKRPSERYQSAALLLDALQTGRQSGRQEHVSAERVARRLQEAETVALPGGEAETAASAAPTRVSPSGGGRDPAPGRARRWPWLILVLLLGTGLLLAVASRRGAVLVVENRLVEPIRLVLDARTVDIGAGATVTTRVRQRQTLVAHWYLVRPRGAGGQPLGIEVQGTIAVDRPRGRLSRAVSAESSDGALFAPMVTNTTDVPLGIIVNAGLAGAADCGCSIPPGASRVHIGYYPLFRNSTVEARHPSGARAIFHDLGAQVERASGAVGLRFAAKDFRE